MSEPPDNDSRRPNSDEVDQLYARERPQPPAHLDASIRSAAAAELKQPPRRPWRYPVGLGAAASALLAVLLFIPEPDVREGVDLMGRTNAPETPAAAPDALKPNVPPSSPKRAADASMDKPAEVDHDRPLNPPSSQPMSQLARVAPIAEEVATVPVAVVHAAPSPTAAQGLEVRAMICGNPTVHRGNFDALPGATQIKVCTAPDLQLQAIGGTCPEPFQRAAARIEVVEDGERSTLIVRDPDGHTYQLGCPDGFWVLTAPP